jgi:hypothetical protein
MESPSKIRSEIRSYVDGKIEYPKFRRWIAEVYADHARMVESEALRLCRAIEWEIADFSEGLVPEDLMKQALSGLCEATDESKTTVPAMATIRVKTIGKASLVVGQSSGSAIALKSASGSFVQGTVGRPLVERHPS